MSEFPVCIYIEMWVCSPFPVSHWFIRRVRRVCVVLSLPRVFSETFSSLGGAAAHLCPPPTPSREMVRQGLSQCMADFFWGLVTLSLCMSAALCNWIKPGLQTLFCIRIMRCLLKCSLHSTVSRDTDGEVYPSSFLTTPPGDGHKWSIY